MTVGAVIVTYNSAAAIGRCLEAIRPLCRDVVVVDNASTDGTQAIVRRYPGVELVANEENLGFAAGVNLGIRSMDNELVLLLNPDTFPETPLDSLVAEFRDPRVGAAAGKLLNEDGKPQRGFSVRRFPTVASLSLEALGVNRIWASNPVNRRYRCLDLDLSQPAEVDQPAGAFLMLRRSVWSELGGFDERFHPLWFEDVDFLKRLKARGYGVRFTPSVTAKHLGAHSIKLLEPGCRQVYWYGSLLKYVFVHFSPARCKAVCLSITAGCLPRMVVAVAGGRSFGPVATYAGVIRMAVVLFLTGRLPESRRRTWS